jgi:hypothetical protein
MKYLNKTFSVGGHSKTWEYSDGWDRIFGAKEERLKKALEPAPNPAKPADEPGDAPDTVMLCAMASTLF